MTTINWGETALDVSAIPGHVVTIYLQRALSHVYNNEAAAAVKDVPDDEKAAELAAWRDAKLAAIMSGDITRRAGGTRGDAVAAKMNAIARERVSLALKAKGIKHKDADVPALVRDYLAKHGDAVRTQALAIVELTKGAPEA